MAGITLAIAIAPLDVWIAANTAVASGLSYEIAGRKLTMANSAEILARVQFWDSQGKRLAGVGGLAINTRSQ
jgi:hypothetical protein